MKFSVTVVALFCVFVKLDYVKSTNTVKTKEIKQKLDHFDDKNVKTWKMRYMVTEKYFKEGGPMFIYVGNENEIAAPYIENGLLSDLAREHNGILFHTEHRFYGKSMPTSDYSLENLKYLSIKQALADLAYFIRYQRKTDSRLANSKVFIAGCSYAGSLVVWFNTIYPGMVDGTWSISGPILAKVDFKEYTEIVGATIKELGSQQCYDRIKNGVAELEKMFDDGRFAEAQKALNLCEEHFDYTNKLDMWTVFREISELFANVVVFPRTVGDDIHTRCEWLMKQKDDLTAITAFYQQKYAKSKCAHRNYFSDVFHNNKTNNDHRPFLYQMCTEFGFFQSSTSNKQPFGNKHSIDGDLQLCSDVFGAKYTKDYIHKLIDETNKVFGGLTPKVRNLYTTHCTTDPWHALAPRAGEFVSIVPKCTHCSHIYSIEQDDSPEMRASKERLFALAKQWLA